MPECPIFDSRVLPSPDADNGSARCRRASGHHRGFPRMRVTPSRFRRGVPHTVCPFRPPVVDRSSGGARQRGLVPAGFSERHAVPEASQPPHERVHRRPRFSQWLPQAPQCAPQCLRARSPSRMVEDAIGVSLWPTVRDVSYQADHPAPASVLVGQSPNVVGSA